MLEGAMERPVAAAAPAPSPARAAWRRLRRSPVARAGLVIVAAVALTALITPAVHHYEARTDADLTLRLKPPTWAHPFGTDTLGRDILVRVLHGARVSLGLGVSSVAVAAVLGSALGLVAGYVGRRVDLIVMFGMDILLAFPATLLAIAIVVYDAIHKILVLAPILMALCRLLLVLMASASGLNGIVGLSIWSALVLAAYIIGLSYLARKESTPGPLQYWPCIFLATPIVLALIVNQGFYQKRAAMLAAILVLWLFRSLRFLYWYGQPNVGRTVSSLLAGIVLVDLLSTGGLTASANLTFAVLFLLAILFQRVIPAT